MTALRLPSGRGTREGMARPARVSPLLSGQPGRKEQLRPEPPEVQDRDLHPSPKSSPARPGRLGPHVAWGAEEGPHPRARTGAWTHPRSTPRSWGRRSEHPARPQPAASGPSPQPPARCPLGDPGAWTPSCARRRPSGSRGAVPQVRSTPARGSRAGSAAKCRPPPRGAGATPGPAPTWPPPGPQSPCAPGPRPPGDARARPGATLTFPHHRLQPRGRHLPQGAPPLPGLSKVGAWPRAPPTWAPPRLAPPLPARLGWMVENVPKRPNSGSAAGPPPRSRRAPLPPSLPPISTNVLR